jgi:hypothetical protein
VVFKNYIHTAFNLKITVLTSRRALNTLSYTYVKSVIIKPLSYRGLLCSKRDAPELGHFADHTSPPPSLSRRAGISDLIQE